MIGPLVMKLKLDDPTDAISVHAFGGLFGVVVSPLLARNGVILQEETNSDGKKKCLILFHNWWQCTDTCHSSKFSKRNYIFPLHSQKLVTYFGQISPEFRFFVYQGGANRKDWSK